MKQIILHIGDRVHHKTLGDGVVIVVNEDYCTARFGEKEANFRIPEAFVRGFLTSEDAWIGSKETEERPVMELSSENEENTTKGKKLTRVSIWWRMFWLCFIYAPTMILLLWLWLKNDESAYLWLAAILFIVAVVLMYVLMEKWDKTPVDPLVKRTDSSKTRISPGTEFMAGMMGAELINREIKREKEAAEKRRYDSLYWQESIRDKNPRHDFDYDHLDD